MHGGLVIPSQAPEGVSQLQRTTLVLDAGPLLYIITYEINILYIIVPIEIQESQGLVHDIFFPEAGVRIAPLLMALPIERRLK